MLLLRHSIHKFNIADEANQSRLSSLGLAQACRRTSNTAALMSLIQQGYSLNTRLC